jgi:hypothetical protein|tara:strand:+ start:653 stop:1108 length:456 start_codon:yes stop_codon:yes gene_type:complete
MVTIIKTISIVLGCCFCITSHILAEEVSRDSETVDYVSDAWEALHSGNHEEVVRLTEACFKECTEQALEQQKSGATITNSNADEFPELNSVGACLLILGTSLRNQGEHEEAKVAYNKLLRDYKDCRCQNEEGYYWRPAIAAQKRLDEMAEK